MERNNETVNSFNWNFLKTCEYLVEVESNKQKITDNELEAIIIDCINYYKEIPAAIRKQNMNSTDHGTPKMVDETIINKAIYLCHKMSESTSCLAELKPDFKILKQYYERFYSTFLEYKQLLANEN